MLPPAPAKRTDDFVNHQLQELPLSMKYRETETHFYMDFHSHEGYEIYFFEEGSGYFLIDDHLYPLEGRDLILISPHESHKSSPKLESPSTRSVLHFLPELLDDRSRDYLLEIFSLSLGHRHVRLSEERLTRFYYLLDRLHEDYTARSGDQLMAIRIYMSELLLELRRCWYSESVTETQAADRRNVNPKVEHAIKYISNHFAENLTLELIAQELYLNQYYLCHLFKKTLGITITEFILQTRIHHARRMLMHTDMPISEIAGKTGFNSFSYFGQTFKTITGATPRDYRKKHQKLSE
ncbi:HTH-type transcriptional activator Btr [Paenibacillus solanacearum]|uniref:HTH-type transcriptional activator Btr n=1 Tax=Paenibacillus solanacearum TaxID=2048548 RepID=A0A916K5U4_9BACL|nr:AraC family transcriptional regulator [Paenibacillus solanacearum]CAG7643759.1 HTH-type transcriptional activator Btr [Paenibacillus solanacearum]